MINSPKGNRTDVSGVMFRKLLVLRSLHTCKQTSWRKEKMKNKKMNDIFKNLLDNYLLISYHINNNNYYYYKMVTKGNYLYMDTIV